MQYQNILLIDDDSEDQEIFTLALSQISEAIHCVSFTNAKEAFDQLVENKINPDIIFLDLNMPIMTGQEFLMKIKNADSLSHIPVIIFSTSSNPSTIKMTKEMGALNFITKPDRFDGLVDVLKPIID